MYYAWYYEIGVNLSLLCTSKIKNSPLKSTTVLLDVSLDGIKVLLHVLFPLCRLGMYKRVFCVNTCTYQDSILLTRQFNKCPCQNLIQGPHSNGSL